MRQYLTDCVLMPHLPVSFLRNESNNDGRKSRKKVKDAYTYFEVSHRHPFIIVALFTELNQYRLSEPVCLCKRLFRQMLIHSIDGDELSSDWRFQYYFDSEFLLHSKKFIIIYWSRLLNGENNENNENNESTSIELVHRPVICTVHWKNVSCGRLQNAPVDFLIVIMINADIFAHIHPLRLLATPYTAFCCRINLYSVSSRCHFIRSHYNSVRIAKIPLWNGLEFNRTWLFTLKQYNCTVH